MSRTLARSRQIEAEERSAARTRTNRDGDFSDNPEEDAAATLIRDDQIDFLDNDASHDRYQDETSEDDNDDVFKYGDGGDEEEAIGLNKQTPHR